ncbi:MAG TPA: single-stranded DNA-binding protein [Virgibacillus sp.]|nr:single-stranded DNA-binding protein [Virgibacillus sp.]
MNNFNCIGRITKDLEVKTSQGGTAVLNNTVAINRPFKNKQTGEREADFINFVAFGKTAEIIAQYHQKGSLIGLSGRMQSRSYENTNGQKVFVTELVVNEMHFTGSNNDSGGQQSQARPNTNQAQQTRSQAPDENPFANSKGPVDISDEMLPFS